MKTIGELIPTRIGPQTKELQKRNGLTPIQQILSKELTESKLVKCYSGRDAQAEEQKQLIDVAGNKNIATLSDVAAVYGNRMCAVLISNHIASLLGFSDVSLMKDQYKDIVVLLCSEYYWINLREWNIFFRRCKLGEYGQIVWGDKLNTQGLTIAIKSFLRDRAIAIDEAESKKRTLLSKRERENAIPQEEYHSLKERAETDIEAFKQLFKSFPNDKPIEEYWKAWKQNKSETERVLIEYNELHKQKLFQK